MKSTKIVTDIQRATTLLLKKFPLVQEIVDKITDAGGKALLVGGAVRDLVLSLPVKDLDIEVHGISAKELEQILKSFGPVRLVGKVFGVFRLDGLDVDWSLPRKDSAGRKPKVIIDPKMSIKDACERRDLTMNAMALDLKTQELHDPFDGIEALKEGVLRAPSAEFFVQDPLRFYRVMQFIGRFGMQPDKELQKICKKMDISKISRERIEDEFEKLLLKSKQPSDGIRWLNELGRLAEVLPELAATIGVPQSPDYHPEGDVFEHTMQTLDAAAQMDYQDDQKKLIGLYAALCHDIGKVNRTQIGKEHITSHGHAPEGARLAKKLLKRITRKKNIIDTVDKLVRYHMLPVQFVRSDATHSAYKRLARKLAPEATMQMLAQLVRADKLGRNQKGGKPLDIPTPEVDEFLDHAQHAFVLEKPEPQVLYGRDIMDIVEKGPKMGEFLRAAYDIQIQEGIHDKKELIKRVLEEKKG